MQTNRKINLPFLGIISDTHIDSEGLILNEIKGSFTNAEGIIHAGDIVDLRVLKDLETIAPVWAVYGNMDTERTRKNLPQKRVVKWRGKRIGVTHRALNNSRGKPEDILPLFNNEKIDCLIFGHSHNPFSNIINSILCFNPGSMHFNDTFRSFGILSCQNDELLPFIVPLKKQ